MIQCSPTALTLKFPHRNTYVYGRQSFDFEVTLNIWYLHPCQLKLLWCYYNYIIKCCEWYILIHLIWSLHAVFVKMILNEMEFSVEHFNKYHRYKFTSSLGIKKIKLILINTDNDI